MKNPYEIAARRVRALREKFHDYRDKYSFREQMREYMCDYWHTDLLPSSLLPNDELTEHDCALIASYYLDRGREPLEIPAILASIARQYNAELPAVAGLLTADYWENRAAMNPSWQILRAMAMVEYRRPRR